MMVQVFIKKYMVEVISLIIIVIVFTAAFIISRRPKKSELVAPPTQAEYEQAAKLPRSQCPCWDEVLDQCFPQQTCL